MEYLNILGQGTYEALDGEIGVTNFNYINSSYCDANCQDKKDEIYRYLYGSKEHPKISKIAKFGCEML